MKNEEINIQFANILQPMQYFYTVNDNPENKSRVVYVNAASGTVLDRDFLDIANTQIGQKILENLTNRKRQIASAYKVPQEVINKMTSVSEAEAMKMNSGGDFYGEN